VETRYRAVLWHPNIDVAVYSGVCWSYGEADDVRGQAMAAGFTRGRVELYVSGLGWEEVVEMPEEESDPDWDREAKFEHARQTGAA
jgi:hypothetical protein